MKRVIMIIIIIVVLAVLAFGGLIGYLMITEYKPEAVEAINVQDNQSKELDTKESIKIMTFNIGYLGLSASEDFVMDGGSKTRPDSREVIEENLEGLDNILDTSMCNIYLLQEVDIESRRSYQLDQLNHLSELSDYSTSFAANYKCKFVPFPVLNPLGKVESGIVTLSEYAVNDCERYALPGEYNWPVSLAHLKRCIMISRIPVEDSDKECVVVNIHLSAYDTGSFRKQQLDFLKKIMVSEYDKGNYVVIGGDFNQTFPVVDPSLYPVKEEENFVAHSINDDFLPVGWQYGVDDSVPTSRLDNKPYSGNYEDTQLYVIDGFIVSPNVDIVSVETLDAQFENSDHNPVIIDIKLQ